MKSFFIIAFLIVQFPARSQDSLHHLSIVMAIKLAETNYPLLKSKLYEAEAAKKNIDLNKNSLTPSLDVSYQANLATANNITGMFYPGQIIPMTGPVLSGNNYNPAVGSAAALLFEWQPFTFGQRTSQVNTSKAEAGVKTADLDNEIFKQQVNVISTYLDLLLAIEFVNVFQKNIDRTEFDLRQSRVLANSGLRPGVDTALFLSELSKARIDLLNAHKNLQSEKVRLSKWLVTDSIFTLTDTFLLSKAPATTVIPSLPSLAQHPSIKFYQAELDLSKSRELQIKRTWLPKLNIWATGFMRGSGVYPDGTIKAADGFSFSKYNYGLGLQLSFPILKFSDTRIQEEKQILLSKSNEAMLQQTTLELTKQIDIANLTLQNALDMSKETPTQWQSADYAFRALQIRYNAGLVNFADLIQSQYNLVKAETDLKRSYWESWKALLYKSAISGDLNIFLNELK
jgi:outer membrane protein TolC